MKWDKHPDLLFIEPRRSASLRAGTAGIPWGRNFVNGCYRGVRECDCGALSEFNNYQTPEGFITTLCVHYLAHHRDEVPQRELDMVATLQCGTATPSALELQGSGATVGDVPPT